MPGVRMRAQLSGHLNALVFVFVLTLHAPSLRFNTTIMRTKALINHFHDLQPIYSAHFEPGAKGRLATAGGDNNVRVRIQLGFSCTKSAWNCSLM